MSNLLKNPLKIPNGTVAALPTETIFGLAVKLNDQTAIDELMSLKNRPLGSDKQFALALNNPDEIGKYALISPKAREIINKYLPGQLTLVLTKNPNFTHQYFDNFLTIGFRIPNFKSLNKIIKVNGPLLLTSANLRDEPPAASAQEIRQNPKLSKHVDKIFLGQAGNNPPTTVLKIDENNNLIILRQGALYL
jgi:L-threonylcarbamoyladenylate synthase